MPVNNGMQGAPIYNNMPEIQPAADKGKRNKMILIIVLSIIAAALIGVLIFFVLKESGVFDDEPTPVVTEEPHTEEPDRDDSEEERETPTPEPTKKPVPVDEPQAEIPPSPIPEEPPAVDSEIENEVAWIQNECSKIMNAVASYEYERMELYDGVVAYYEDDEIIYIQSNSYYTGEEYSSYYFFVDGELIYAEYSGYDLNQLYYEDGELIRWSYYPDASDSSGKVNYDKQYTTQYLQWNERVLSDTEIYVEEWLYQKEHPVDSDEYIFPDSDSRYIDESELEELTQTEVRTAINELYARHGRIFKDPSWKEYFESKSWYTPTVEADDFSESVFNAYEKENNKTFVKWEEDHGWR